MLFLLAPFLIELGSFSIGLVLWPTFLFLRAIVFGVFYGRYADFFENFLFYLVLFVALLWILGEYYHCSGENVEAYLHLRIMSDMLIALAVRLTNKKKIIKQGIKILLFMASSILCVV